MTLSLRVSEDIIEEIRKSIDIVDIISEYVQLKKQGKNFIGLCPFHGEKTPSFSVSPDKQLYHCFGCGAGGNVFSFIMETEGLPFLESVKKIADRMNMAIPELEHVTDEATSKEDSITKIWHNAHALSAKLFHHVLTSTDEGKEARDYLRNRGFTKEVIDTFQIGYAPNSWDFLASFLEKRKFPMDEMVKCGILSVREFDQKPYDRFRDRIIFPIWNNKGDMIAFGGRILSEGNPKYLNSPESSIFNKSETLYYFHKARPSIRKKNEAILFEGYVDVISAWKAGVDNGVASLGTALSTTQAKMLRRLTDHVILCYDSDNAGQNATMKNAAILSEAGLQVRVAILPDGMDPDDYIQKMGVDRFNKDVIGQSLTLMGFKFQYYRRGKNLKDDGERMTYIHQMIEEVSKLSHAVERDHYLRRLSEEFSLSLEALKQQQIQVYKQSKGKNEERKVVHSNFSKQQKRLLLAYENAERILIAHMLKNNSVANQVQRKVGGAFNIDEYQAIAAHLFSYYADGFEPNPSSFIEYLEDDKLKRITSELAMMTITEEMSEQELADYIKQIKNYPKRLEVEKLKVERKKLEEAEEYVEAAKIAMEIIKIEQDIKNG
ncbi:DNA primase [Evansella cellulosilytica]|uniref:DNA primase n=1 Tax=Evansella cellulosilytica (strain ATCC 21833 / DSM 2522 / FERM P-1141 / JCM 9156 / N-4) TaxID=649639 RepID=E6TW55_EVAC2|nr:DNA primase [Evansella cellulosilytica DSM 2522]